MSGEVKDSLTLGIELTLWSAVIMFVVYCSIIGKGIQRTFSEHREYRAATFTEGQTYERGIVAYGDILDILELHYGAVEIEIVRKSLINGSPAEYVYRYGLYGKYFTVDIKADGTLIDTQRIGWRDGVFYSVGISGNAETPLSDNRVMTFLGLSYVPCADMRGSNFTANEFTQEMYQWARETPFACSAIKDPLTGVVTKIQLVQVGG